VTAVTRLRALNCAKKYIGVTEHPPGSNRGRLIDRWNLDACGLTGVFWCCSFQHGMFKEIGFNLPGGASVGNLLAAAKTKGWIVKRPLAGDLACFEFNEGTYAYDDHIGIVEHVLALRWNGDKFTGWITTIEGNTSSGKAGSQFNGGGVYRRRRWVRGIGAKFIRVP
jgi:hypothetical protein